MHFLINHPELQDNIVDTLKVMWGLWTRDDTTLTGREIASKFTIAQFHIYFVGQTT